VVWFAENRLREGILFQRPIYAACILLLLGIAASYASSYFFPASEFAPLVPLSASVIAAAGTLHRALHRKAESKLKWNFAISFVTALLSVALSQGTLLRPA
jgi:hypothetical protein